MTYATWLCESIGDYLHLEMQFLLQFFGIKLHEILMFLEHRLGRHVRSCPHHLSKNPVIWWTFPKQFVRGHILYVVPFGSWRRSRL